MSVEPDEKHQNIVAMLRDACSEVKVIQHTDGSIEHQLVMNTKKIWYKTHIINSPHFGRYSFYRETLGEMASQAKFHMSLERAAVVETQLNARGSSYDYSIDSKSSESVRDKNNIQPTMVDRLNRNLTEKRYSVKEETKKGIMDGILGRDVAKDQQQ